MVFARYPDSAHTRLLAVRRLLLETAVTTDGVGELTETLKWGEVSFLTEKTKSGTTIRIGWRAAQPEHYAMFLNCNTTLIADFRAIADLDLAFEGHRAIIMPLDAPLPRESLEFCIRAALTYHQ